MEDPGMTTAEVMSAVLSCVLFIWWIPEVGIVGLFYLFTTHLFGIFALTIRQFTLIWAVGAAALALPMYIVGDASLKEFANIFKKQFVEVTG
jgi:hypothetical protein